jgi:hypothetical protein
VTRASDNAFPSILIAEGTEPSAPAAGKQRLYIDSTSHHLSRTDSAGAEVDLEAFVGCSVANSALQAISNNSATALTFDTESSPFYDVGNVHSTTNFTATSAGKWYMHCSVDCDPAASGVAYLTVAINGSEVLPLRRRENINVNNAQATGQIFAITTELILALNDVVTFLAFQNSGGSVNWGSVAQAVATFRQIA